MLTLEILDQLPASPLHIIHNGAETLAAVQYDGDVLLVTTDERTFDIDDTYTGSTADGVVTLYSEKYDSEFVFRALELEDRELLVDGDNISNVEELSTAVLAAVSGGHAPLEGDDAVESPITAAANTGEGVVSPYNFTVDENGVVLELIMSDDSGVYVRDNADWVEVNTDEEQPTIDDLEWVEVTEDAVPFWDNASGTETVARDQISQFEVSE